MKKRKHRVGEFFRRLHQKKAVRLVVSSLMVLVFPIIGAYAHWIEPRRVAISRLKIPIKRLPASRNPFRIVQISDLHFGPTNRSVSFLKKCVEKINRLKPDLVAVTGDFLQWDMRYLDSLAQCLSKLKSNLGIFATLGNHDYGVCHEGHHPTDPVDHSEIISRLEEKGVKVLHNEKITLLKEGHAFEIVGVGDFWTQHFDPRKAFSHASTPGGKNSSKNNMPTTILLCHNPDGISVLDDYPFDLMLAGHVHGGQISFPFIGPLAVPVKNRRLRRGLHRIGQKWLYTNRGLGHIFRARLLSRPEIACLDLVTG